MKTCTRCKASKALSDYSQHRAARDGLQSQCKACAAERAVIRRKGNPCLTCGKPKEVGVPKGARLCMGCATACFECKVAPRRKQHRLCADCQSQRDKERNKRPERQRGQRITRIASKYRVSREEATLLADATNCGACGADVTAPGASHVDHCHKSLKVRGPLCFHCNASLGHLGDDPVRVLFLVSYLSRHQGGVMDLLKAKHCIEKLIENEQEKEKAK